MALARLSGSDAPEMLHVLPGEMKDLGVTQIRSRAQMDWSCVLKFTTPQDWVPQF